MFEPGSPKANEPTDYTGVKIGAILIPVFLLFALVGNADVGLTVCVVLVATTVAIKIRWRLRKHLWFWAVIVFMLGLHVPLFLMVRWPQGNAPTLFYTVPLGIADFLMISAGLRLAEKLLSTDSSSTNEQE